MKRSLLAIMLLSSVIAAALSQNTSDRIVEGLEYRLLNFPQEKVYVHHDKPHYVLGERIWYKCYLVDAIYHQSLTPSLQVNVELYDPDDNLLNKQIIRIENGGGGGDFQLDPEWQSGRYVIRAYTEYQKNFDEPFMFEKEIRVYDAYANIRNPEVAADSLVEMGNVALAASKEYDDLNIFFFPEGGAIVNGLSTIVAVNAFDMHGNGVALTGLIVDSDRNVVSRFNTHETGLGFFAFNSPTTSKRYFARVTNADGTESSFSLPRVESSGYTMRITQKRDTITITSNSTSDSGLDGAFIVGHLRGKLFGVINGLSGNASRLRIPLTGSPEGILHFTLFNSSGDPLCERLVFHLPDSLSTPVDLDVSKQRFARREEVSIDLNILLDTISFAGSMTVTDLGIATPEDDASNIVTYLLLESDLRGRIPSPGFFMEGGAANKKLLDILMLTHGWKRFEWKDVITQKDVHLEYMPEQALSIKGYTTKFEKPDKPVQARVFLSVLNSDFTMQEQITNEEGEFDFNGLIGYDTIPVMLQAEIYKAPKSPEKAKKKEEERKQTPGPTGNRYVDIKLDPAYISEIEREDAILDPEISPNKVLDYFAESRRTQIVDSAYQDIISVTLDEVVVTKEKYDPVAEQQKKLMWYNEPDSRVYPDSLPFGSMSRNIFELIRGSIPGVEVLGTFPNYEARIRGANSIMGNTYATYVIDGVPTDAQLVNNFPVERVAFIDVLRSLNKTAIFGSGGNGVIAIYTKTGEQMAASQVQPGLLNMVLPGYYTASAFVSPDYGINPENDKPDYRTTLYWNPNIIIAPKETNTQVQFYASDRASVYSVRLEGLTADGRPIAISKLFEVQ